MYHDHTQSYTILPINPNKKRIYITSPPNPSPHHNVVAGSNKPVNDSNPGFFDTFDAGAIARSYPNSCDFAMVSTED
jgi:hypothetical protein